VFVVRVWRGFAGLVAVVGVVFAVCVGSAVAGTARHGTLDGLGSSAGAAAQTAATVQTATDTALCSFPLAITLTNGQTVHPGTAFGHSGALITGPVTVSITNTATGKTATVRQSGPILIDNTTGDTFALGSQLWAGGNFLPYLSTNGLIVFNSAFDITFSTDHHPQVIDPCALVSSAPPSLAPRATPPPWAAPSFTLSHIDYAGLIPLIGNLTRHDHNHLDVIVNGQPVAVPAGIGQAEPVDVGPAPPGSGETGDLFFANVAYSPLHTHSDSGMIHLESDGQQTTFTLGQFFDEWAVRLTPQCLGSYCDGGGKRLTVYVNGSPVAGDPRNVVFTEHQEIAVVYGAPGVPSQIPATWTGGWPDGTEGCGGAGEPSCGPSGGAG
jgi:hypothetical protein